MKELSKHSRAEAAIVREEKIMGEMLELGIIAAVVIVSWVVLTIF